MEADGMRTIQDSFATILGDLDTRFEAALQSLPLEETASYREAQLYSLQLQGTKEMKPDADMAVIPGLSEPKFNLHQQLSSMKEMFLHAEGCDVTRAARRLSLYWTRRAQAFHISSDVNAEALKGKNADVIKKSSDLLPVSIQGRSILYLCDPHPGFDSQTHIRIQNEWHESDGAGKSHQEFNETLHQQKMQHLFNIADITLTKVGETKSEQEREISKGQSGEVVLLVLVDPSNQPHLASNRKTESLLPSTHNSLRERLDLILDGFPLRVHSIHICCLPISSCKKESLTQCFETAQSWKANLSSRISGREKPSPRPQIFVHFTDDNDEVKAKADIRAQLERAGFIQSGIPTTLGGPFVLGQSHGHEERMKLEYSMSTASAAPSQRRRSKSRIPSTKALQTGAAYESMKSESISSPSRLEADQVQPWKNRPCLETETSLLSKLQKKEKPAMKKRATPSPTKKRKRKSLSIDEDQKPPAIREGRCSPQESDNSSTSSSIAKTEISTGSRGRQSHRVVNSSGSSPESNDPKIDLDSIIQGMKDQDKRAYIDAKKRAPQLVETETTSVDFYKRENKDSLAAARRLCRYWKKRMTLFGKRALKPMTQTGEGTLTRSDLDLLGSGSFCILPKDKSGHCVLYIDCSKLAFAKAGPMNRVAFYMLLLAKEISSSRDESIVLIFLLDNADSLSVGDLEIGELINAIPTPVFALHLVQTTDGTANEKLVEVIKNIIGSSVPEDLWFIHSDTSRGRVLRSLAAQGLEKEGLPKAIGGGWGVERLVEWLELRTRYEWDVPPGANHRKIDKVFDFSNIKETAKLTEHERVERNRRMNVLHSRRKRERERIEIDCLREQCNEIKRRNQEVTEDNTRVEGLLLAAEDILRVVEPKTIPLTKPVDGTAATKREENPSLESGPPLAASKNAAVPASGFSDSSGEGKVGSVGEKPSIKSSKKPRACKSPRSTSVSSRVASPVNTTNEQPSLRADTVSESKIGLEPVHANFGRDSLASYFSVYQGYDRSDTLGRTFFADRFAPPNICANSHHTSETRLADREGAFSQHHAESIPGGHLSASRNFPLPLGFGISGQAGNPYQTVTNFESARRRDDLGRDNRLAEEITSNQNIQSFDSFHYEVLRDMISRQNQGTVRERTPLVRDSTPRQQQHMSDNFSNMGGFTGTTSESARRQQAYLVELARLRLFELGEPPIPTAALQRSIDAHNVRAQHDISLNQQQPLLNSLHQQRQNQQQLVMPSASMPTLNHFQPQQASAPVDFRQNNHSTDTTISERQAESILNWLRENVTHITTEQQQHQQLRPPPQQHQPPPQQQQPQPRTRSPGAHR